MRSQAYEGLIGAVGCNSRVTIFTDALGSGVLSAAEAAQEAMLKEYDAKHANESAGYG